MNTKCLNCHNESFVRRKTKFEIDFKEDKVSVEAEAFVCNDCNTPIMDLSLMGNFQQLVSDTYRRNYRLLTSQEIKRYRFAFKFSQQEFAEYLGVGIASLKRWEGSGVQEKAHDELIRLKCDLERARKNVLHIEARNFTSTVSTVSYNSSANRLVELFESPRERLVV